MKKKAFKYFTIMQYKKEEEYLREMHKAGWKFERLSGFCMYHFEKCEPQDVVYKLDYNKDGLSHKNEYVQMFNDCGWEYIQDYVGYSYFRKPASDESKNDEIFCDDESRFQMMARVFKGRVIPLLIMFFTIIIPQLVMCLYNSHFVFAVFYALLLMVYVIAFTCFAIEYFKYKKNLK